MPLDPKFNKFTTAQQALVNFDWKDVAAGTGIIIFDAMTTQEGATVSFNLKTTPLRSKTLLTASTNGVTPVVDIDFDLTQFNSPRKVGGTCYVICRWLIIIVLAVEKPVA